MLVRLDLIVLDTSINLYPKGIIEVRKAKIKMKNFNLEVLNMYYLRKSGQLHQDECNHYFQNLGNNSIIVGDLNAHHQHWDTKYSSNISGCKYSGVKKCVFFTVFFFVYVFFYIF